MNGKTFCATSIPGILVNNKRERKKKADIENNLNLGMGEKSQFAISLVFKNKRYSLYIISFNKRYAIFSMFALSF